MAEISGPLSNQASITPPATPPGAAAFREPISGQLIERNNTQPVADWIKSLPPTEVGLSTLEHWQSGSSPQDTVHTIEAQLRAQIAPAVDPLLARPSLLDGVKAEFDQTKVGYAMGQAAAGIEARIAANPTIDSAQAKQVAAGLRNRGAELSNGAALEANAVPDVYAFKGQCYPNADALAHAVSAERLNPSGPVARAYTPEMQRAARDAEMDRAIMNQPAPYGTSYAQTAYFYARAQGANSDQAMRAYHTGSLGDTVVSIGAAAVAMQRPTAPILGPRPMPEITNLQALPRTAVPANMQVPSPLTAARVSGPVAGGGVRIENLSAGEIVRIQNAAERGSSSLPVVFDGEFATQKLLGTTTTPGGRQVMFHAADRMVNPPNGRISMSLSEVDKVLEGATSVVKRSYHPGGSTLTIENANMSGKPRVIVDEATGQRVITVINPKKR